MAALAICVALVALILTPTAAASGGDRVLYVGDSLGAGTVPNLPLSGVDSDTRVGRASAEGLAVLRARLRPHHQAVVFDVGTNDWSPATLAYDLRTARAHSGRRPLVVLTISKPGAGPFNRVVRTFARRAAGVTLIDWHAIATARSLLGGDAIHASAAGYELRARLVARALP